MNPPILETIGILSKATVSPLYRWIADDFDAIEMNRKRYGTDWQALSDLAIEYGVMAGRGRSPTAKIIRQTYYRVRAQRKVSAKTLFNRKAQNF